nr:variable large family protein [Borreliella valaisiana]
MIGAAKKGGEKNDGGGDIGNVAEAGSNGAKGDEGSVKAIASGMKGIVDAAKKAGVDLKADAVNGGGNEDAGKLFATDGGGANANAAAVNKAAKAVSGVSGDQILNAIVTSGNGGNGANAQAATNPIDAAIGAAGDNGQAFDGMTADDKIAAAIVLRGMAKDGKFALTNAARDSKESLKAAWLKEMIEAAKKGGEKSGGEGDIGNVEAGGGNGAKGNEESVRAIASGMKGIVEAAKKAGVELKAAAGGNGNADAGKLFATNGGGHANANAVNNVVKAISGVSGDQILNAIVTSGDGNGKKAQEATNPIDAAIGTADDDNGQAFDGMTADDKIAAAIVLRGMAKDGKFALANAASKESLKATVVKGNDRSF